VTTTALLAGVAAVLFDMDGTIVDSDAAVARAWTRWSRERGVDFAEIARVTPGRPATESVALLAPWLDPAEQLADAEALLSWERADVDDVAPTAGALELIAALDAWRVPHAVVTSADDGLARIRLAAAGIAAPEVLVTSTIVERGKPDPEGYLMAAACLGVPAGACLVVEDTSAGVQAGLAAGAVVAGVRDLPDAHLVVADLHELHRLLKDRRDQVIVG
jgi:sugar-phosphatase